MSRTVIERDSDLLVEVSKLLGTSTATDTVNMALREYMERLKAAERLRERGRRGEFDEVAEAHQAAKQDR